MNHTLDKYSPRHSFCILIKVTFKIKDQEIRIKPHPQSFKGIKRIPAIYLSLFFVPYGEFMLRTTDPKRCTVYGL